MHSPSNFNIPLNLNNIHREQRLIIPILSPPTLYPNIQPPRYLCPTISDSSSAHLHSLRPTFTRSSLSSLPTEDLVSMRRHYDPRSRRSVLSTPAYLDYSIGRRLLAAHVSLPDIHNRQTILQTLKCSKLDGEVFVFGVDKMMRLCIGCRIIDCAEQDKITNPDKQRDKLNETHIARVRDKLYLWVFALVQLLYKDMYNVVI